MKKQLKDFHHGYIKYADMKTQEQTFREWCRTQINRQWTITASGLTLLSFYCIKIEKPKTITAKMFDWLRSIASDEIKSYKSKVSHPVS